MNTSLTKVSFSVWSNVTLYIVLISLRNSPNLPENPSEYIQDYFGRYRDPLWDEVDYMKSEISSLTSNIDSKEKEIQSLKQEISRYKRIAHVKETFSLLGPDNNGIVSTKALVQKLSGQPRFEIDLKLNQQNFLNFIMESLIASDNPEDKNTYWTLCYTPIREMCTLGEDGKPRPPPFSGRLEDPNYQRILEKIRSYTPR